MSVTHSLDPVDLTNYAYALNSSKFNKPVNSGSAGNVLSLEINNTSEWISGSQLVKNYGMFYGLTSGTGYSALAGYSPPYNDYAATISPKSATPGSGRVPFPRNNGTVNNIVLANSSQDPQGNGFNSLLLPNAATYEVSFNIHTTEPGQFNIELTTNGTAVDLPETVTTNLDPTSGGHEYTCNALITTSEPNCTIAVVNGYMNSTALTITPSSGSLTHAFAQRFSAKQL